MTGAKQPFDLFLKENPTLQRGRLTVKAMPSNFLKTKTKTKIKKNLQEMCWIIKT